MVVRNHGERRERKWPHLFEEEESEKRGWNLESFNPNRKTRRKKGRILLFLISFDRKQERIHEGKRVDGVYDVWLM
jgi:hypothetical protein